MQKHLFRRLVPVAAAVAALSLTACGGSGTPSQNDATGPVEEPSEPVTISFATWDGGDPEMKQLKADFEKEYPNITVEFRDIPADSMTQTLTTQIAGNNPPDVANIDAGATAAFASRGGLVNLDDYIDRSDVIDPDAYVDVFRTFATYEGSMYGLPIDGESTALFYRTDMFEEAGIEAPPTTWEELEETAAALTKPEDKQYGLAMFAPESAYYWYPFLWQNGGDILTEDGQPAFASPEAIEAAEYYVGLTEYAAPDHLNSNSWDARLGFFQGQMAMYIAGSWFAGVISEEAPDLEGKWASANLPEGSAGCGTTVAGDVLVMFEGSDKKDAAWKWIEFLSRPDNMSLVTFGAPNATVLPTTTELLESEELAEAKPLLLGFADAMQCGVSNTQVNENWPRMEQALNDQLARAMYGDVTAEEALLNAEEEARSILN